MKSKDFFNPISTAEEQFLKSCHLGHRIEISSDGLDASATDIQIRAELLRAILLNEHPKIKLPSKGLRVKGAQVIGRLDLQGATIPYDISLTSCVLEKSPNLINARLRGLHLSGSQLPGIIADHAYFEGSVFCRSGFHAEGEISLPGARIYGDLQICDAEINSPTGFAIFAPSSQISGSVYLGDYPYDDQTTKLSVDGSILFTSATIRRDFYCSHTAIYSGAGPVDAVQTENTGIESKAMALSLNRAEIGGVLFFKSNQITRGIVNFAGLVARRLNDDPADERENFKLRLDGFDYQAFSDQADLRLKSRLEWLRRRPTDLEFSSQPYEHLAAILSKIGHRSDALDVLYEKERFRNQANRDVLRRERRSLWAIPLLWLNDFILRTMIGYGYRPFLALVWGCVLIGAMSVLYQKTWDAGDFAPNAAPILISEDWIEATLKHPSNPAKFWSNQGEAGQDYETFNAIAYSADILIPIVNLGQEEAWAPSTTRSYWGKQAWWVRWFAKAFGWVITALGAAAITGAIRNQ